MSAVFQGSFWLSIICVMMLALCVMMLFRMFQKNAGQSGNFRYFQLACLVCIVGYLTMLMHGLPKYAAQADVMLNIYSTFSILAVSGFCLHVYTQSLNKEPRPLMLLVILDIPVAATILVCIYTLIPQTPPQVFNVISAAGQLSIFLMTVCMYQSVVSLLVHTPAKRRTRSYIQLAAVSFVWVVPVLINVAYGMMTAPSCLTQHIVMLFCQTFALVLLYGIQLVSPAEDAILASYGFVMEHLSTLVLMLDGEMQVIDWNRKMDNSLLPNPRKKEPFAQYKERLVQEGACVVSPHNDNILAVIQDGKEMQYFIHLSSANSSDNLNGYLVEISEVTPIYSILNYFREAATIDNLTQLHSRNAYNHKVPLLLAEEENLPLLLMVGDVNGLKRVNDTMGHIEGDKLLRAAADGLRLAAPDDAFLCRLGGDEYAVLLPQGSEEDATQMIDRMEAALDENPMAVPMSWGYTVIDSVEDDYDAAFVQAEEMMYHNKKAWYRTHNIERRSIDLRESIAQ